MTEILPRKWWTRKPSFLGQPELVRATVLSAVVVLVGVGGFGLGRLTVIQEQKGTLAIHAAPFSTPLALPTPDSPNNSPIGHVESSSIHNFVASKNGTKYYSANCSGSSRIKEANQVWFETVEAAAAAGYKLASNCATQAK